MVESILLVEGEGVDRDRVRSLSLGNAKQLVFGHFAAHGLIVHVAATSREDLQRALLDFSQLPGVTGVLTLAVRSAS
jgi:hypothetical protein